MTRLSDYDHDGINTWKYIRQPARKDICLLPTLDNYLQVIEGGRRVQCTPCGIMLFPNIFHYFDLLRLNPNSPDGLSVGAEAGYRL